MAQNKDLPPGQRDIGDFPRFGLSQFARRFPQKTNEVVIDIRGDVAQPIQVSKELEQLERVEQTSDFHCVTTWSACNLNWSGFRFTDFYEACVHEAANPDEQAQFVIFKGQDGYRCSMQLDDLLTPDVILADRLDGEPLSIKHGAPIRLVAPAHYGYKNAKHIQAVEFWRDDRNYRSAAYKFMEHPRGRVAYEERGRGVPGWILRQLYRPLIHRTIKQFQSALSDYLNQS